MIKNFLESINYEGDTKELESVIVEKVVLNKKKEVFNV